MRYRFSIGASVVRTDTDERGTVAEQTAVSRLAGRTRGIAIHSPAYIVALESGTRTRIAEDKLERAS